MVTIAVGGGLESWGFQFFEKIMRTCHKFHNFFINMTLSAERQDKKSRTILFQSETRNGACARAMRGAKVHHGRSRARIHGRDEKRYDAKDAINQLLF